MAIPPTVAIGALSYHLHLLKARMFCLAYTKYYSKVMASGRKRYPHSPPQPLPSQGCPVGLAHRVSYRAQPAGSYRTADWSQALPSCLGSPPNDRRGPACCGHSRPSAFPNPYPPTTSWQPRLMCSPG
jgi:hypothetical protein